MEAIDQLHLLRLIRIELKRALVHSSTGNFLLVSDKIEDALDAVNEAKLYIRIG